MDDLKHLDEEDSWSLTSSTAASVRTIKSKLTVPVAPSFRSAERVARRKEFYEKLGEKHKALEAEKQECAARTKEEEEAAIKQLRKNMVYKANPVPSFYQEGPPPKAELKKLPVTRAKSPNFTRRKSCGDVTSREEKKDPVRSTRHSIGAYREYNPTLSAPKKKDQTSVQRNTTNGHTNREKAPSKSVKGTKKTSTKNPKEARAKDMKETPENGTEECPVKEMNGRSPTKEMIETSHDATDQPREDIVAVQS
ncbi:unnamed protein product [Cuscuta campestris]|uniref:TPX2 C-terminal domain-containing protein n=1 Tax=Cuscuta campestris TaxID=132261 RepID=A0A484KSZ4_9ASTE|nr:unnamed protein product [Cuscuta campestris]